MNTQVILIDVMGATERLRALKDAHPNVIGITPHDKPCEGFTPIVTPEEWLPLQSYPDNYSRRCWWACGKLGIAAIRDLALDADFYWLIESDCVARQETWANLFSDHEENNEDGVFVSAKNRGQSPNGPVWGHPCTPSWANCWHINAIYRLSRRAVEWCIASAEETRESFGEMVIGSEIQRHGGSVGLINRGRTLLNCQTIKADPTRVLLNRTLINHPVKSNTYEP